MKTMLICPSERPGFELFSESYPLACVPLCGQGLVEYWLSDLAASGAKEVLVLAHDRSEQVLQQAGDGVRWGLRVEVVPESRELSPAQASLKYAEELKPASAQECIRVLDHFPGLPQFPLFSSVADWFTALTRWLPRARTPERVGARELSPGVWAGFRSRISRGAELRAPCWIGRNAFIGPKALVGPHAIVEDGAFVETSSAIVHSYIGPDTYVGMCSEITNSVALGNQLLNWQMGTAVSVPDSFLLCSLRPPRGRPEPSWLGRAANWYARNKGEAQVLWKHLLMNKEG